MTDIRQLLVPMYRSASTRSLVRSFLPVGIRTRLREWIEPREGTQWCRVVMNREVDRFIRGLDCPSLDVLEISGTGSGGRYDFKSYEATDFPAYDVCKGPLAEAAFDLVIAEQVLEHVARPDLAASNVFKMLRPGGKFIVSTPFLLKIHAHPDDFYRWTENGMRYLLETAGFEVVRSGSWGNRECLIADLTDGIRWTNYEPAVHTLRNELQFPIVVWAFASKHRSEGVYAR